jgi:hypothetical protein
MKVISILVLVLSYKYKFIITRLIFGAENLSKPSSAIIITLWMISGGLYKKAIKKSRVCAPDSLP